MKRSLFTLLILFLPFDLGVLKASSDPFEHYFSEHYDDTTFQAEFDCKGTNPSDPVDSYFKFRRCNPNLWVTPSTDLMKKIRERYKSAGIDSYGNYY